MITEDDLYERQLSNFEAHGDMALSPIVEKMVAFESSMQLKNDAFLVDVGCGPGPESLFAIKNLPGNYHVLSVDMNEEAFRQARKMAGNEKLSFVAADASKIPFRNVDAILCSNLFASILRCGPQYSGNFMIHDVIENNSILHSFHDALSDFGRLYISEPAYVDKPGTDCIDGYINGLDPDGKKGFIEIVESHGFGLVEDHFSVNIIKHENGIGVIYSCVFRKKSKDDSTAIIKPCAQANLLDSNASNISSEAIYA